MAMVELAEISKYYGKTLAVDNVSLSVRKGEFLTLLGPSGCGKTTTLRIVAGFIQPDKGSVRIRGEDVTNKPPYERNAAMVFQNYALFPHMTVYKNLEFGLKMHKVNEDQRKVRIKDALELVGLPSTEERYPRQLSGGQQQRVALARALVVEPDVLLLDEPLSNLDLKLRERMRIELKQIQQKTGVTSVYVTHDQLEALALSDRIVVIHNGKIVQIGEPKEVYEFPATKFVADFMGGTNFFDGRIVEVEKDLVKLVTDDGLTIYATYEFPLKKGEEARMCVRPYRVRIRSRSERGQQDLNSFSGIIERAVYSGSSIRCFVRINNNRILVAECPTNTRKIEERDTEVIVDFAPDSVNLCCEHNE